MRVMNENSQVASMRVAWLWIVLSVAGVTLEPANDEVDDVEQLSWLAGTWRAAIEDGVVEEYWTDPAGGLMLGLSRTLVGGEAVGFEFLRIEARSDEIIYVAQPNGRPGTEFELTVVDGARAVFENPAHDHPKILRYVLAADGILHVSIEGDEGVHELAYRRVANQ